MNTQHPHSLDPRITEFAERISRQFDPERIILFGSYARGEPTFDSDVDLLVVIKTRGSQRDLALKMDLALSDRTLPLDLIVVTPEQFERDRSQIGSIIRPAAREGIVLYERAA